MNNYKNGHLTVQNIRNKSLQKLTTGSPLLPSLLETPHMLSTIQYDKIE
jgi:hypothetical protein